MYTFIYITVIVQKLQRLIDYSNFRVDTSFLGRAIDNWFFHFQLLNAMQNFGANLDDYLHLLLPPVVKLFDSPDIPLPVRR